MMMHLPDVQDPEALATGALRDALFGGSAAAVTLVRQ